MVFTIYTATGCTRCKIVKQFMAKQGIAFEEYDMKAEGKEPFQKFYAAHRKEIFRGPDGIEFPLLTDGTAIRQGIGASIGFLQGGHNLDGFFSVGTLHQEWVDGIHVSGGNPAYADDFLAVLRYIKIENNMKLQIDTNGSNSAILEQILAENLADVMIMQVVGPKELYSQIVGQPVDLADIEKSMALTVQFPRHQFQTTVVPVVREDGDISYLTKEEIGSTAKFIADATGSMKNPYLIKLFNPKQCQDQRFKSVAAMTADALLPYRTAARKYQVFVEVEKD